MRMLETDRLILRDWTIEDIGCEVYGEDEIRYLLAAQNNYAVVLKENGVVIGTIGLNEDADNNPDVRNVGICLLEPYWNQGLMSEALKCVIQNAGDYIKELSYLCETDDMRSQHIAQKFGFQYVKTFHNVQSRNYSEPKDFYYYRLELRAE